LIQTLLERQSPEGYNQLNPTQAHSAPTTREGKGHWAMGQRDGKKKRGGDNGAK